MLFYLKTNFNTIAVKSLGRAKEHLLGTIRKVSTFSTVRTSSRSLAHFFRKGNKENREIQFRHLIINRESKKRSIRFNNVMPKRVQPTVTELFKPFYFSATPFIGLKTRRKRRGKRIIHKLSPLDRARSERKPFVALSSILRSSGRAAKSFKTRLEQELDTLYSVSRTLRVPADRGLSSSTSTLRDKRDLLHRTAFYAMPRRWLYKTNKTKANQEELKLKNKIMYENKKAKNRRLREEAQAQAKIEK